AQKTLLQSQLTVKTGHFQLMVDATIGGRHSVLVAMLARDDSGTLRTIARDYSQKFARAQTRAPELVVPASISTDAL
ncbi:MAG: hypothetical protein Q8J78_14515, partial [Moraxellaceae bacterium]|nr:hypothetical protein [Moraxellaceae bacterium]